MENIMIDNTAWEQLKISNDFIFGKIMQDPGLCKGLLQRILPDLKIDRIEYPETQKAIRPDIDAKSVRLDVYVEDGRALFTTLRCRLPHQRAFQNGHGITKACWICR